MGKMMLHALTNTLQRHDITYEGRRHERFEFDEPCEVERWGKQYHAVTRNISEGGICIDVLGMGSTIFDAEITIRLRDYAPFVAIARWSYKRTFGMKFTDPIEKNPDVLALVEQLRAA